MTHRGFGKYNFYVNLLSLAYSAWRAKLESLGLAFGF